MRPHARPGLRGLCHPSDVLRLLAAALLLTAAGCGDDPGETGPPEEPELRVLDAELVSPYETEGAVVLEMSADRVREVRAPDRFTRTVSRVEGDRRQVAVVRTFKGRLRFQVVAEEGTSPPEIEVLQVAAGDNRLRESLDGYRVELTP